MRANERGREAGAEICKADDDKGWVYIWSTNSPRPCPACAAMEFKTVKKRSDLPDLPYSECYRGAECNCTIERVYFGEEAEEVGKSTILKMDEEKRLVYGIVLEPDIEDSQGDVIDEAEIEKAAHYYLEHHRLMKEQHRAENLLLLPVESYIAPCDFTLNGQPVRKGSWVMAAHINDEAAWQKIKKGEYSGFSIGGTGKREKAA